MAKREEKAPQSQDEWLAGQFGNVNGEIDFSSLTPEEQEAARALMELMGDEYAEDWKIGKSIGSIPSTPWDTEGDTGEHPSVKKKK